MDNEYYTSGYTGKEIDSAVGIVLGSGQTPGLNNTVASLNTSISDLITKVGNFNSGNHDGKTIGDVVDKLYSLAFPDSSDESNEENILDLGQKFNALLAKIGYTYDSEEGKFKDEEGENLST